MPGVRPFGSRASGVIGPGEQLRELVEAVPGRRHREQEPDRVVGGRVGEREGVAEQERATVGELGVE
jgi:hypothetical protein